MRVLKIQEVGVNGMGDLPVITGTVPISIPDLIQPKNDGRLGVKGVSNTASSAAANANVKAYYSASGLEAMADIRERMRDVFRANGQTIAADQVFKYEAAMLVQSLVAAVTLLDIAEQGARDRKPVSWAAELKDRLLEVGRSIRPETTGWFYSGDRRYFAKLQSLHRVVDKIICQMGDDDPTKGVKAWDEAVDRVYVDSMVRQHIKLVCGDLKVERDKALHEGRCKQVHAGIEALSQYAGDRRFKCLAMAAMMQERARLADMVKDLQPKASNPPESEGPDASGPMGTDPALAGPSVLKGKGEPNNWQWVDARHTCGQAGTPYGGGVYMPEKAHDTYSDRLIRLGKLEATVEQQQVTIEQLRKELDNVSNGNQRFPRPVQVERDVKQTSVVSGPEEGDGLPPPPPHMLNSQSPQTPPDPPFVPSKREPDKCQEPDNRQMNSGNKGSGLSGRTNETPEHQEFSAFRTSKMDWKRNTKPLRNSNDLSAGGGPIFSSSLKFEKKDGRWMDQNQIESRRSAIGDTTSVVGEGTSGAPGLSASIVAELMKKIEPDSPGARQAKSGELPRHEQTMFSRFNPKAGQSDPDRSNSEQGGQNLLGTRESDGGATQSWRREFKGLVEKAGAAHPEIIESWKAGQDGLRKIAQVG